MLVVALHCFTNQMFRPRNTNFLQGFNFPFYCFISSALIFFKVEKLSHDFEGDNSGDCRF